MAHPLKQPAPIYTYEDYLSWPEDERWEIIDGEPYNMSPASNTKHQRISVELSRVFGNYLKGKSCEVFAAPFDVRLPKKNENENKETTVVQPDLVIICDKSKIDEKGCKGAPDLAIEIISAFSASRDYVKKTFLYQKHGIREYWVINPAENTIAVYILNKNSTYDTATIYSKGEKIKVAILEDLVIDSNDLFSVEE